MKIGIDARFWNETGVGRYIRNLVSNLQTIDEKNEYVLFINKNDKESVTKTISNSRFSIKVVDIPWHSVREQIAFSKEITKENVDLMHFPYFAVPLTYRKPFVVTIHDLILHHFSTGEASTLPLFVYKVKLLAYKFIIKHAAQSAKKIIAVSHATKEEIVDHLHVNSEKVEVIYEGFNLPKESRTKVSIEKPYFLHVGNVYPHKNVKVLVHAFENLSQKSHLYFIGKEDYFMKKLKEYVTNEKKIPHISFLHNVTDQELTEYYKGADAVIVSSLMEGFGLPAVEAIALNTPVIVSNIDSLREVTGGNALFFDPSSSEDLKEKMEFVFNSPDEIEKVMKNATKYIEKYDWGKMAKETLKIYESCTRLR